MPSIHSFIIMVKDKYPCTLLINDVHVNKDNIQEFHKNWAEALQICEDNEIVDLIIGGDLWHSRSSQTLDTLLAVRQAMMEAHRKGICVTSAEGNHCKVDQESIYGYSHVFSEYPSIRVIDEFEIYEYDGFDLFIISYFPENGSFVEKLDKAISKLNNSKLNVLYIHEGINGALANASDDELPTHLFEDFDQVLVGHYHNRCKIKGTNIEYIGSSRQHNFGEDEEKGYTILYSDGSYKFVKNQVNLRYKTFEVDAEDVNDNLLRQITIVRQDPRYLVKVKITGTTAQIALLDKNQLIDAGVSKIDTKNTDIFIDSTLNPTAASLDVKYDKSAVKSEYAKFCESKEIDNVEFGLSYLEKIS